MPRSQQTSDRIIKLTGGLVTTAVDLTILVAALGGGLIIGSFGTHPSRPGSWKVPFIFADWVYSAWDKSKFRRALGYAVGEGLFEKVNGGHRLTSKGTNRLKEFLPSYKIRQPWDGKLWLITYDISEDNRKKRDTLREYIEKIGCGMVQKSVWLSIKDPRPWLKLKITDLHLKGSVIISCLGKDGNLGEEKLETIVANVFKLEQLNEKYRSWQQRTKKANQSAIIDSGFDFLMIMEQDPMIASELLPDNWVGDKAAEYFEKNIQPKMGHLGKYLKA